MSIRFDEPMNDPETWECDCCHKERSMTDHQIIIGMKQFCSVSCKNVWEWNYEKKSQEKKKR